MINRRSFIAAALASSAWPASAETPRSPFGPQSTAEEVTAGIDLTGMTAVAATQCYVATSPRLAKVSGECFRDCNPATHCAYQQDAAMAARLWDVSARLTIDIMKRMQHY